MLNKSLFALPFAALVLIGAKPASTPVTAPPMPSFIPPPEVASNPANRLILQLSTGGTVVILMRPDLAPHHVERIQALVRGGFYDGTIFHRVIPGFMAQGGDPKGTGEGGSELPDLQAEFTGLPFVRGSFGAARAEKEDSANSQFFIMYGPNAQLDGNYTVMGRVISGMDAVDKIAPGEPPPQPTKIVKASIGG